MKKVKRYLRDKSFITLLAIGIMLLIIIGIIFILNGYNVELNTKCYWTTEGIICSWGEVGE